MQERDTVRVPGSTDVVERDACDVMAALLDLADMGLVTYVMDDVAVDAAAGSGVRFGPTAAGYLEHLNGVVDGEPV